MKKEFEQFVLYLCFITDKPIKNERYEEVHLRSLRIHL